MARTAAGLLLGLLFFAPTFSSPVRAADSVLSLAEGLPSVRAWARYDLILGRLRVSCGRTAGQSTCTLEHPARGITENYVLQVAGGAATTRYDAVGAEDSISAVVQGEAARIEYQRGSAPQLILDQPAQGPVMLAWFVEGKPRRLRGQTIWQLLLIAPPEARECLSTILCLYRRDWDLDRQQEAITAAIAGLDPAQGARPSDRQLRDMVAQLKAPTFAGRREAQRRLAAVGQAAYPFLAALDPSSLDAQQRQARRELLDGLAAAGTDSPERVALWLAAEDSVWRAIAERGTPDQQEIARLRLGGGIVETAAAREPQRR